MAYDSDILWSSGGWEIGMAYEASSMPVMPGAIVARAVIRREGAHPVDAVIYASGRVTFGDGFLDVPPDVRDRAAGILRDRYDRLRMYSTGSPPSAGARPKASASARPRTRTVTKVVVEPPRDSRGRFLPWSETPSSGRKSGKSAKTKTKTRPKASTASRGAQGRRTQKR